MVAQIPANPFLGQNLYEPGEQQVVSCRHVDLCFPLVWKSRALRNGWNVLDLMNLGEISRYRVDERLC